MIVFAHLLNDASGSPRVLKNVIEVALSHGLKCKLFLGYGGQKSEASGLLGNVNIPKKRYYYQFYTGILKRLIAYSVSQLLLFTSLILDKDARQAKVIYVNTLLPVGAMVFGALLSKRVIVHIHELSLKPLIFHRTILWITQTCASKVIFVSKAQSLSFDLKKFNSWNIIYNGYDPSLIPNANLEDRDETLHKRSRDNFQILMLASLRDFKGIPAFLELTNRFLDDAKFHFTLVLNEEPSVVDVFRTSHLRSNLTVVGRPDSTRSYYQQTDLVLNLSYPDQFIETFGLTLVEGMAFAKPVIGPPIGGPTEIILDGENGFLISAYELDEIALRLEELRADHAKYDRLSKAAKEQSERFSPETFRVSILKELSE